MNYFLIEITDEQIVLMPTTSFGIIRQQLRELEQVSDGFYWLRGSMSHKHVIYGYGDDRVIPLVADILNILRQGELVA